MPTPKKNEKEKDFIDRCMEYPDMQDLDIPARYAKCKGIFKQYKKEKKK